MGPEGAEAWYGAYLAEEGHKASTIKTRKAFLRSFLRWLKDSGIQDLTNVTRKDLEDYARHLRAATSSRTQKAYQPNTLRSLWLAAVGLMTALVEAEEVGAQSWPVKLIRGNQEPLPTILSEADIVAVLEGIDTRTTGGRRDRAVYELIYSAGLRVSEATKLKWEDVNLEDRLASIRQSKFDKDRVVPLTHEAVEMLRRHLAGRPAQGWVFSQGGKPLNSSNVNRRFKILAEKAGVYRPGVTVHQLRHACASHLIAHGADIRYVQELLGHESIQTTVRYTRDQVEQVRRYYRSHHPRENQLYLEVDGAYRTRIEALKALIVVSRQKRLAKLRERGYDGDESFFYNAGT